MNKFILTGRITKDPEVYETASGKAYCHFTLAVNAGKNAQGEPQANFITVTAWEKLCDILEQYVKKGDMLAVEGSISNSTKGEGEERTTYTNFNVDRLEMLGGRKKEEEPEKQAAKPTPRRRQAG